MTREEAISRLLSSNRIEETQTNQVQSYSDLYNHDRDAVAEVLSGNGWNSAADAISESDIEDSFDIGFIAFEDSDAEDLQARMDKALEDRVISLMLRCDDKELSPYLLEGALSYPDSNTFRSLWLSWCEAWADYNPDTDGDKAGDDLIEKYCRQFIALRKSL